jgi:putative hemolysin
LAALGNDDGDNGANIGMPNPASVFCEEQGGTVEIVADEDGNQWGICQLADGTQIDEWEYWRQFHSSGVDMCV